MTKIKNNQLRIFGSCLSSLHLILYLLVKQIILDKTCSEYMSIIIENKQLNQNRRLNLPMWLGLYSHVPLLSLNFCLSDFYMIYTHTLVILHKLQM